MNRLIVFRRIRVPTEAPSGSHWVEDGSSPRFSPELRLPRSTLVVSYLHFIRDEKEGTLLGSLLDPINRCSAGCSQAAGTFDLQEVACFSFRSVSIRIFGEEFFGGVPGSVRVHLAQLWLVSDEVSPPESSQIRSWVGSSSYIPKSVGHTPMDCRRPFEASGWREICRQTGSCQLFYHGSANCTVSYGIR